MKEYLISWRTRMGLLEAFGELCATEGPLGEIAIRIGEGIFECGNSIADALDDFADKLGEVETGLAGEDGEESCWAADRLDPEWEKTPELTAMRNAVDGIVDFCETMADKINEAALNLMPGDDE
jgi:hypothetical protein